MIYFDSNLVIYLASGTYDHISVTVRDVIENSDLLCISPIVMLELEYLQELKRLSSSPKKIFNTLHRDIGLSICEKPFQKVVSEAVKLSWTRDPFDRIITAHAAIDGDILLTSDSRIRKHYKHAVW